MSTRRISKNSSKCTQAQHQFIKSFSSFWSTIALICLYTKVLPSYKSLRLRLRLGLRRILRLTLKVMLTLRLGLGLEAGAWARAAA